MSDGLKFEVPNQAEWMAELMALPEVMQQRVVRGAVATGASVVRKEAILKAPTWTGPTSQGHPPAGTLKKSIYQARITSECTPTVEVFEVRVRTGKFTAGGKANKYDAYYAKWVEYGHYARAPKGQAKNVKSGASLIVGSQYVMPRPFMRPAFESKKAEAVQAMQTYINENMRLATGAFRYIKAIS